MPKHIQDGRLTPYAAHMNRKIDRAIRERKACAACGQTFNRTHPDRQPDDSKPDVCHGCALSLD
jgi:hypothetical protein